MNITSVITGSNGVTKSGKGTLTLSAATTMFASGTAHVVHNPVILNAGLTTLAGTPSLIFTNDPFARSASTTPAGMPPPG